MEFGKKSAGIIFMLVLSLLGAAAAGAGQCYPQYFTQPPYDDNGNPDDNAIISACTNEINSGQDTGNDLVMDYFVRGSAYSDKGQYDQAIADYNKDIELSPSHSAAYAVRGGAYAHKGQFDLAISDYTRAIELNYRCYSGRGDAYYAKGQYELAIADYNKGIELGTCYGCYYGLGNIYKDKGQYDQAISNYTRAIQENPTNADAFYNRGKAHEAKKEQGLAEADFKKACELDKTYILNKKYCH